jgi:hypothetical protein
LAGAVADSDPECYLAGMSRLALLAALCLACAGEDVRSGLPDPSGMYALDAAGPDCLDGAETYRDADTVVCWYECLAVDGRDVRSVTLEFTRGPEGWGRPFDAWVFGACE